MIAIISALDIELELLEKAIQGKKAQNILGKTFFSGTINSVPVVVVKSGVGKVHSACVTTLLINNFNPSLIIFSGIAGGISNNLKPLDVVIASAVCQHDYDLSPLGDEVGKVDGFSTPFIETCKKSNQIILDLNKNAIYGIIATGDQFIASNERASTISKTFGAIAVEMEGGAVGQIASGANVPFLVLRVISDSGKDSAPELFAVFCKKAAKISSMLVISALQELIKI